MICWYAKQLIENKPLNVDEVNTNEMRYSIFQTIVGYWLSSRGSLMECPFCDNDPDDHEWIQCDRCDQWYHKNCVNITDVTDKIYFFCPVFDV